MPEHQQLTGQQLERQMRAALAMSSRCGGVTLAWDPQALQDELDAADAPAQVLPRLLSRHAQIVLRWPAQPIRTSAGGKITRAAPRPREQQAGRARTTRAGPD